MYYIGQGAILDDNQQNNNTVNECNTKARGITLVIYAEYQEIASDVASDVTSHAKNMHTRNLFL